MDQNQTGKKCSCLHHEIIPIFLILIGLTFLLNAWAILSDAATAVIWPIILILIGFQKLMGLKCPCCNRGVKPAEMPKK